MEILFLIFGAFFIGGFLIFLLALSDKKRKSALPLAPEERKATMDQFERACFQILEGLKLEVENSQRSSENEVEIFAHSGKETTDITSIGYIAFCKFIDKDQVIKPSEILELSSMVIQERRSKGFFITTGKFSPELSTLSELAPMSLIDGEQFQELLGKHAADYRVILS